MENGKGKQLIKSNVIGIPKGLPYYLDEYIWEEFFNLLGYRVEYSENSSQQLFELGNKYVGSDQCYPVKLYYGHVISLLKKTKNIFIPQYVSMKKGTYCCPKVIALPYLIKNSLPFEFNLITTQIDSSSEKTSQFNIFLLGLKLTLNLFKVVRAMKYYKLSLKNYNNPTEKKSLFQMNEKLSAIGVVGHKYALYDSVLNMDLLKKISSFGFNVITSDKSSKIVSNDNNSLVFNRNKPHWDFGHEMLESIQNMLLNENIKGIIFITYFGCGIDAFVEEVFKNEIICKKPYLCLTLDEHAGEAGVMTRIEAFLDMINRKGGRKNHAV